MKKIIVVGSIFLFMLLSGCGKMTKITLSVFEEEKIAFQKEYELPFVVACKNIFLYNGEWEDCIKKEYGSKKVFLEENGIYADIVSLCQEKRLDAREGYFEYLKDGLFEYKEGENGRDASTDEVASQLVVKGNYWTGKLVYKEILPKRTRQENEKLICQKSRFETKYSSSSENRKKNICVACERLDNCVVHAGEQLSFNKEVGKRRKDSGFFDAVVIVNGEYTEGVGGGVCQVSSALYNCWCLAGLEVGTSKNHSLPSSYIDKGLDAMVSESQDLVLINNSGHNVYLDAEYDTEHLIFTLYGEENTYEVKVWSQKVGEKVCAEYEETEGEEYKVLRIPSNGEIYQSYRAFYLDGKEVLREKMRLSAYSGVKGKKIVPRKACIKEKEFGTIRV